jgi:hypothetical protein
VKIEEIYVFRKRSITSNIIGHFVPLRSVLSYGTRFRRGRPPGLAAPDHTVPYGTDLSGTLPRHFVPGYDRVVPTGRKYILRAEVLIKLALMG